MRAPNGTKMSVLSPVTYLLGAGLAVSGLIAAPIAARPAQQGPTDLMAQTRQQNQGTNATQGQATTAPARRLPPTPRRRHAPRRSPRNHRRCRNRCTHRSNPPPAPDDHRGRASRNAPGGQLEPGRRQGPACRDPGIGSEGLFARDYQPATLAALIAKGQSEELDTLASHLFIWLAEAARRPHADDVARAVVRGRSGPGPASQHRASARSDRMHDVPGVLASLDPAHPDYAMLRDMLAKTKDPKQIAMIRANMDRWRWLGRDLGLQYLIINVPEQELRLTVNNKIIRTSDRSIRARPQRRNWPSRSRTWCSIPPGPCRSRSSWAKGWART
jgi:hypothetical protein